MSDNDASVGPTNEKETLYNVLTYPFQRVFPVEKLLLNTYEGKE